MNIRAAAREFCLRSEFGVTEYPVQNTAGKHYTEEIMESTNSTADNDKLNLMTLLINGTLCVARYLWYARIINPRHMRSKQ